MLLCAGWRLVWAELGRATGSESHDRLRGGRLNLPISLFLGAQGYEFYGLRRIESGGIIH